MKSDLCASTSLESLRGFCFTCQCCSKITSNVPHLVCAEDTGGVLNTRPSLLCLNMLSCWITHVTCTEDCVELAELFLL